jgi:hypothetical protein
MEMRTNDHQHVTGAQEPIEHAVVTETPRHKIPRLQPPQQRTAILLSSLFPSANNNNNNNSNRAASQLSLEALQQASAQNLSRIARSTTFKPTPYHVGPSSLTLTYGVRRCSS